MSFSAAASTGGAKPSYRSKLDDLKRNLLSLTEPSGAIPASQGPTSPSHSSIAASAQRSSDGVAPAAAGVIIQRPANALDLIRQQLNALGRGMPAAATPKPPQDLNATAAATGAQRSQQGHELNRRVAAAAAPRGADGSATYAAPHPVPQPVALHRARAPQPEPLRRVSPPPAVPVDDEEEEEEDGAGHAHAAATAAAAVDDEPAEEEEGEGDDLEVRPRVPRGVLPLPPLRLSEQHSVPSGLVHYLRPYQLDGVRWMYSKLMMHAGCILGDDMGLGKTAQTVALLAALLGKTGERDADEREWQRRAKQAKVVPVVAEEADAQHSRWEPAPYYDDDDGDVVDIRPDDVPEAQWVDRPTISPLTQRVDAVLPILLLVPRSVVAAWKATFKKLGYFHVQDLKEGNTSGDAKDACLESFVGEVLITTVESLERRVDAVHSREWGLLILDESHRVRNPSKKRYAIVNQLATRARLCLTGTPLQNDINEVHAQLALAVPGSAYQYSHHSFKIEFSDPLERAMNPDVEEEVSALADERMAMFRDIFNHHTLRRMKNVVLAAELPAKREHVVFCRLSPLQAEVYNRAIRSPDIQAIVNRKPDSNAPLWVGVHGDSTRCLSCRPNGPLTCMFMCCLMKLVHISSHLELVKPRARRQDLAHPDDEVADFSIATARELVRKNDAARTFAQYLFRGDIAIRVGGIEHTERLDILQSEELSGKLVAVNRILQYHVTQRRQKVLIFSRYVRILKVLHAYVRTRFKTAMFTGSMNTAMREETVDAFNHGTTQVMLLSKGAGGVGLTLNSAAALILWEADFNPATDAQAQDRIYRIGQTQDVQIYRLLSAGTVEELIFMRQLRKTQAANRAISGIVAEALAQKRHISGMKAYFRTYADPAAALPPPPAGGDAMGLRIEQVELAADGLDQDDAAAELDRWTAAVRNGGAAVNDGDEEAAEDVLPRDLVQELLEELAASPAEEDEDALPEMDEDAPAPLAAMRAFHANPLFVGAPGVFGVVNHDDFVRHAGPHPPPLPQQPALPVRAAPVEPAPRPKRARDTDVAAPTAVRKQARVVAAAATAPLHVEEDDDAMMPAVPLPAASQPAAPVTRHIIAGGVSDVMNLFAPHSQSAPAVAAAAAVAEEPAADTEMVLPMIEASQAPAPRAVRRVLPQPAQNSVWDELFPLESSSAESAPLQSPARAPPPRADPASVGIAAAAQAPLATVRIAPVAQAPAEPAAAPAPVGNAHATTWAAVATALPSSIPAMKPAVRLLPRPKPAAAAALAPASEQLRDTGSAPTTQQQPHILSPIVPVQTNGSWEDID